MRKRNLRVWVLALVASCIASALALTPSALASSWASAQLPGAAGKVFLLGVSCPSRGLCVAVGTNNLIASSTDPTGGSSSTWRVVYAGEGPSPYISESASFISGRQVQGVSCPSTGFCVAVTDQGNIYSSTQPTGPASAWRVTPIEEGGGNTHLEGVSCPTASLCVAVSGGRNLRGSINSGKVFTSTNPTSGASTWQSTQLNGSPNLRAVSCGSPSLCVAVGAEGRIVTSTDPTGGAAAWNVVGEPGGPGVLGGVSCVAAALCVSGNESGNLLSSNNPSAGASSWSEANGGGSVQITGVSCPSASECIAVDDNGDVLTSTDPAGGAAAWSFANIVPFTTAEGNALFAASCPSASLCAVTGSLGQIFTNSSPFASPATPETTPRGKKGKRRRKRPKVKIASLLEPSNRQLEDHTGRELIRFYSRERARGFICKLDRGRFKPCRSPKRYPIRAGNHIFRVRAIGFSGLRGPVAVERFTVGNICEGRDHKTHPC
jgi:hypothetical protein